MSKPSRNGPRYGGSKKKQKRRPDQQSVAQAPSSASNQQPVQPQVEAIAGNNKPSGGSLQFRPRARENAATRPVAARAGASARAFQQAVDYSYVYTDLKIIGGLSAVLMGGLIALTFILR